jgi:hypothetical protein
MRNAEASFFSLRLIYVLTPGNILRFDLKSLWNGQALDERQPLSHSNAGVSRGQSDNSYTVVAVAKLN